MVTIRYQKTEIVFPGMSFPSEPARNYNADTTEPVTYTLQGAAAIAVIARYSNPGALTEDMI